MAGQHADLSSADLLAHNGGIPFLLAGDDLAVRQYARELHTRYRILLTVFREMCRELDAADARERAAQ